MYIPPNRFDLTLNGTQGDARNEESLHEGIEDRNRDGRDDNLCRVEGLQRGQRLQFFLGHGGRGDVDLSVGKRQI